jgi:hypothetical protein
MDTINHFACKRLDKIFSIKLIDILEEFGRENIWKDGLLDRRTDSVSGIHLNLAYPTLTKRGSGSVVGIATGYEMDDPGIESRWGRDFPHLSRPDLGPTQPPVQ